MIKACFTLLFNTNIHLFSLLLIEIANRNFGVCVGAFGRVLCCKYRGFFVIHS